MTHQPHDPSPTSASTEPRDPTGQPETTGLGRRGFLTLATAGIAASTLSVTIGSFSPATAATAPDPTTGAAPSGPVPRKRELRAMWISSVVNIDWPSAAGLSAEQQKAEYLHWLDVAEQYRLNAVFVQVFFRFGVLHKLILPHSLPPIARNGL